MVLTGLLSAGAQGVSSEHVRAEWMAEDSHVQPGTPFVLGLKLSHALHWHTYWINPGESGLATSVQWDLPDGFTAGPLAWPTPQWMTLMGLTSFGYDAEIMALVEITPPASLTPGEPVRLAGELMWLECADLCVPGGGPFALTLPVADDAPTPAADRTAVFARARAGLPADGEGWSAVLTPSVAGVEIKVTPPDGPAVTGTLFQFFPVDAEVFDYAPGLPVSQQDGILQIQATWSSVGVARPDTIRGVLAAPEGWTGDGEPASVWIDASPAGSSAASTPLPHALWLILLLAFAGGMILNAMPCVFPVISLKILGFVNLADSDPRKVWIHGVTFAAGVMVSFWVLAGALIALKASVPSIGWGYQLSRPGFVVGMTTLFLLLSLNLFGVFELGTSLTGLGGSKGSGLAGTFFSGVLATLVATPCTGPFMATAVGAALTQPPAVGMAIFTALGAGMALPYLLLSRYPQWLKKLPRPGPWMESMKQFMGFLLMAFVLYLVWLFTDLRDLAGLGRLLTGLLLISIGAWVYGRWGGLGRSTRSRLGAAITAALLVVGGVAYAAAEPPASPWQDYSPEFVETLKASGEPFFIDFTATWCLTCQANKKAVLNTDAIQSEFRKRGVTLVKADWTNQPAPITQALAAFGRSGVPLYVLYSGEPDGEPLVLPELLTKGAVLDALQGLDDGS